MTAPPPPPLDEPTLDPHELAAQTGLPLPLARILHARGHRSPAAIHAFLHPNPTHLHDPHLLHGLPQALARLRTALLAHERILIYGDYDVDGTVATVLLKTALERAANSLAVTPDIRYHIPHRLHEGYGIRETRLADAASEGVRLVVSVDTGIRAHAAAHEAARLGLDLIVTDHHLPDLTQPVPHALAVLNPNQPGCPYPCKDLCGAGVAFKLAQALLESSAQNPEELQRLHEKTLPSFLKLLAIATVADAVPLTGENRTVAALGLHALRQPAHSGLRSLMELAGIDLSRPISATDIGFRLGPRINAAGRMDIASDVVELFLTRDPAHARQLALKLHELNDIRRSTEATALHQIEAQLETLLQTGAKLPAHFDSLLPPGPTQTAYPPILVLDDTPATPWHRGVIGILASRVVERTGRPALILTHEDGQAHGSGRSISGFHLLDALTAAHVETPNDPLFLRFGGHAHAAGFTLPSSHVPLLRERMTRLAAAFDPSTQPQAPAFDAEITLADLTPAFLVAYQRLAPFGHGNPEPLFLARDLQLAAPLRFIKDRYLGLQLREPNNPQPWRVNAWSRRTNWANRARTEAWTPQSRFTAIFRLNLNHHPTYGGWELDLQDLHLLP